MAPTHDTSPDDRRREATPVPEDEIGKDAPDGQPGPVWHGSEGAEPERAGAATAGAAVGAVAGTAAGGPVGAAVGAAAGAAGGAIIADSEDLDDQEPEDEADTASAEPPVKRDD